MARPIVSSLALLLPLLGACTAPAQPAAPAPAASTSAKTEPTPQPKAEPVRVAPTRPSHLWPVTRLRGTDYVALRDLAKHYGLKAAWTKPNSTLTLSDARGVRFIFEKDQRDFRLDGARLFLGEITLHSNGDLWVPRLDVIKTIAPLFAPAEHTAFLPAPPRLIVLDPGHGGTDPGTENRKLGVNEKTFALDVALRLKKILETSGYHVLLTRDKDTRFSNNPAVDLPMRADVANKAKADLFVSIHFNHAPESIAGIETYIFTPQFMPSTADQRPGDSAAQAHPANRQDTANTFLGYHLHRALLAGLKSPDRGFKRARWAVLRQLDCPGVLVECAYLSNDAEARLVATPEHRQRIAESLAEGIRSYTAALTVLRPPATEAKK